MEQGLPALSEAWWGALIRGEPTGAGCGQGEHDHGVAVVGRRRGHEGETESASRAWRGGRDWPWRIGCGVDFGGSKEARAAMAAGGLPKLRLGDGQARGGKGGPVAT